MNECYKVLPRKWEDITLMARRIRKITKTLDRPFFPILHFVEYVFYECFDVVTDSEFSEELQGLTYPLSYTIQLKESVYNGLLKDNPQDRFTLAHELGHLLMHDNYIKTDQKLKHNENPEVQADTFAKELLAPSYFFDGINYKEIAQKCKIPQNYALEQQNFVLSDAFIKMFCSNNKNNFLSKDYYIAVGERKPFPPDLELLVSPNNPVRRRLRITK